MLNQSDHEIFRWNPSSSNIDWHSVIPLRTEASTRKFWRCTTKEKSFVLMFAPPETEHNSRFIQFASLFKEHGVPVPEIFEYELDKGYFLLEDVGEEDFFTQYEAKNVDYCLAMAMDSLRDIQAIEHPDVPNYEKSRLSQELEIFCEFLCTGLIGVRTEFVLEHFEYLVKEISSLPKVTVHRDYHCRNLLVREDEPYLGVVDFQDALVGPITYDLASLLYDCYWDHDQATIERNIEAFWTQSLSSTHGATLTKEEFSLKLKLTALQRLLKAAGIFVRLWLQRHQTTHLQYVLPTLRKAQRVCAEIESVRPLGLWIQREVIPVTLLRLPRHS